MEFFCLRKTSLTVRSKKSDTPTTTRGIKLCNAEHRITVRFRSGIREKERNNLSNTYFPFAWQFPFILSIRFNGWEKNIWRKYEFCLQIFKWLSLQNFISLYSDDKWYILTVTIMAKVFTIHNEQIKPCLFISNDKNPQTEWLIFAVSSVRLYCCATERNGR